MRRRGTGTEEVKFDESFAAAHKFKAAPVRPVGKSFTVLGNPQAIMSLLYDLAGSIDEEAVHVSARSWSLTFTGAVKEAEEPEQEQTVSDQEETKGETPEAGKQEEVATVLVKPEGETEQSRAARSARPRALIQVDLHELEANQRYAVSMTRQNGSALAFF